jgi:CBS domain containing-hemolysin-like protein
MFVLQILFILILVAANGFFVAAEFALVKIRLGEVNLLVEEQIKGAKLTKSILKNLDSYLSACQLGITFASLGLGWIGEPLIARQLGPLLHKFGASDHVIHAVSFAVAFSVITFLHITIGEQVPKIYAIQRYQKTSLAVGLPLLAFYRIFKPFIWFLNASSNVMLKAVGIGDAAAHGGVQSESELRMLMRESSAGGHVTEDEVQLMANVLDLEDKVARAYMTPRQNVVFLTATDPVEDSLANAASTGHTRYPLCEGDLDKTVGIINVKDIFTAEHSGNPVKSLVDIAREPVFVSEIIPLDVLLARFLREKSHMFILVDEFGAVSGIITLENVIEEVVGQIQDEFDAESPDLRQVDGGAYEANGACALKKVIDATGLAIEDGDADTIGGMVIQSLGRIPAAGKVVTIGEHRITILEADERRIIRIRIEASENTSDTE